jgi:K+-sensing histidine kinase KdpD
MGDRLHLLSVVFNLVDNALKYSPENPDIKIAVEEKENNVELRVADNGVGIPDEYKTKVFEKVFPCTGGNVHNIKGYGLGLSYAASVVKKHGGTIEAKNNEGGGTSIYYHTTKKSVMTKVLYAEDEMFLGKIVKEAWKVGFQCSNGSRWRKSILSLSKRKSGYLYPGYNDAE